MTELAEGKIEISSESDIVVVRRKVREVAGLAGFGLTDVTRIITAASELARNIVLYAGSGMVYWRILDNKVRKGLELVFEDHGPGIADIDQAMQPGFSTSGGLGMGLPGAKRLMDEMELDSRPGHGVRIRVAKWRSK